MFFKTEYDLTDMHLGPKLGQNIGSGITHPVT
jgi:hypothetical protein